MHPAAAGDAASPTSRFVDPAARVLAGRPLRPSHDSPLFEEDAWPLAGAVHRPNIHFSVTLRFDGLGDPLRALTLKECAYAGLTQRPRVARKRPPNPASVYQRHLVLLRFSEFLGDVGVERLDDVGQEHLDAFLETVRRRDHEQDVAETSPQHLMGVVAALQALFTLGDRLSHERLRVAPWRMRPARRVVGWVQPRENTTPRVPLAVLSPLLRWALFYVEEASADILAALEERERNARLEADRPRRLRGETPALLAAYLRRRADEGRGLPLAARPSCQHPPQRHGAGCLNRRLISVQAGFSNQRLRGAEAVALLDEAVGTLGVEVGGYDTPVSSFGPDGSPWRPRFNADTVLQERHMLQTACYVVTAFLSGMRDSEVQSLRTGCLEIERDEQGEIVRHRVRGQVFKGRRAVGDDEVWVVHEAVAKAVAVLEALGDGTPQYLFQQPGRARGGTGHVLRWLEDFQEHVNGDLAHHGVTIPEVDGRRWQLTTRQFRRTLAWFIGNEPYGVVALKIQLKHVEALMSEGYAGTSPSGFPQEVEAERELAQIDLLEDLYEGYKEGRRGVGRAGERLDAEFAQVQQELGDFPGQIVDERRKAAMLKNLSMTLHPGFLNDCLYDPQGAMCRVSDDHPAIPVFSRCQPQLCPNSRVDRERHLPKWIAGVSELTVRLSSSKTRPLQRVALGAQLEQWQGVVDRVEAVSAP